MSKIGLWSSFLEILTELNENYIIYLKYLKIVGKTTSFSCFLFGSQLCMHDKWLQDVLIMFPFFIVHLPGTKRSFLCTIMFLMNTLV